MKELPSNSEGNAETQQTATVSYIVLERNGWCFDAWFSRSLKIVKKERAVDSCGLRKWQNRAGLHHCFGQTKWDKIQTGEESSLRGLQLLLGQHMWTQQQDNSTVAVFTWVKQEQNEWLQMNSLLVNCNSLAVNASWKYFFYHFRYMAAEEMLWWWRMLPHFGGGRRLVYWADS